MDADHPAAGVKIACRNTEGRGDGSEWWAPYTTWDTIRVDADSSLFLDDFIITGHAYDAIKGIAGGPGASGVAEIRNGIINAPVQYQSKPLPYNAATAYAVGDVFYAVGTSTGPNCFRVLQPFTNYASAAGQALPAWSKGYADAWIKADEIHADIIQLIAASNRWRIENVVVAPGVADRLKGPRTIASVPIANAIMFVGIAETPSPRRMSSACGWRIRTTPGKGSTSAAARR